MDSFPPGAEIRIADEEDLWQVRELAEQLFPPTYEEFLDRRHINYMMDLFYSPEALVYQLDAGQHFLLLYYEGNPAGYASYTPINEEGDFKLNKIYLDAGLRGMGLGKLLIYDIIARVKSAGGRTLQLTVSRHNTATGFYEKMGFTLLKEEMLDIGGGYFMDDWVMQYSIEQD